MMPVDVTSAFLGITTPLPDLYKQIGKLGWSVKKVKWDKKGDCFVATATNPHGEEIEKTGNTDKTAVANLLLAVTRKHHMRTTAQEKVGMWKTMFTDQIKPIAEAYVKAPTYDPKAAAAFKALADDSVRRAAVLGKQLKIEVTDNPEPYANAQEMAEDIHKRKHFVVSRANSEHPVWTPEQNVAFRTVHDVLGHAVSGGDFGWEGENRACAAHFPLLNATAQQALFTECIAQTAYAAYYRAFGPQKVCLFPEFTEPAQSAEGVGVGTQGVHPSQSTAPVAMPGLPQSPGVGLPKDNMPPHEYMPSSPSLNEPFGMFQTEPSGYFPSTGIHVGGVEGYTDPNAGWSSGVAPQSPNAYLDHGDPLGAQETTDNASLIDTEWAYLRTGEGKPDYERMKQAIVNAFRVVLLSPRKDLRWNTIHYQDLAGIPAGVTDPAAYWNTLEQKRQEWNVQRFGEGERFAHMPYWQYMKSFENIIFQMNPQAGYQAAQQKAKDLLFDWQTEEQNRVMREDRDKKQQRSTDEVERLANAALAKRMKTYIKEFQPQLDFASKVAQDQLFQTEEQAPQVPVAAGRYGAWMGSHLKAISQISQHADDILKAALEDVHNHDGEGHHFRAAVLQMGISGVGPKVCSFAWLLLQPMTSQLATIDVHMMGVLGHNYDKEMNNRDYFKFERELGAGRDAAGYGHIPLGPFQWGMWDLRRTGEGTHQDHSGMKVLDPLPHTSIDWNAKLNSGLQAQEAKMPDWWENTKPFRDEVGDHWDEHIAPNYPQTQVPYNEYVPTTSKTAAVLRTPWYTHPQSGERVEGQPGQTIMQHATQTLHLTTPEVWEHLQENAGKA